MAVTVWSSSLEDLMVGVGYDMIATIRGDKGSILRMCVVGLTDQVAVSQLIVLVSDQPTPYRFSFIVADDKLEVTILSLRESTPSNSSPVVRDVSVRPSVVAFAAGTHFEIVDNHTQERRILPIEKISGGVHSIFSPLTNTYEDIALVLMTDPSGQSITTGVEDQKKKVSTCADHVIIHGNSPIYPSHYYTIVTRNFYSVRTREGYLSLTYPLDDLREYLETRSLPYMIN